MWILYIVLSTGVVENLEFSNVESCQHAIELIEIEIRVYVGKTVESAEGLRG